MVRTAVGAGVAWVSKTAPLDCSVEATLTIEVASFRPMRFDASAGHCDNERIRLRNPSAAQELIASIRNRSHGCATGPRATRFGFDSIIMTCASSAQPMISSESENGAENDDAAVTFVFVTLDPEFRLRSRSPPCLDETETGCESGTAGPKDVRKVSFRRRWMPRRSCAVEKNVSAGGGHIDFESGLITSAVLPLLVGQGTFTRRRAQQHVMQCREFVDQCLATWAWRKIVKPEIGRPRVEPGPCMATQSSVRAARRAVPTAVHDTAGIFKAPADRVNHQFHIDPKNFYFPVYFMDVGVDGQHKHQLRKIMFGALNSAIRSPYFCEDEVASAPSALNLY